jgi:anti-sigma-K factor RskA/putative zinc finger protein
MNHVTDELELFALGALPGEERARVAAHLTQCPACREQAKVLEDVAVALPDTLAPRDTPGRLRARILATARSGASAPRVSRGTAWTAWLRPGRLALVALSLAVLVLGAVDLALVQRDATLAQQRDTALAQRDEFSGGLYRVAHGGRTWYMAGLDQWAGSGGTLFSPAKPDAAPYVVFHDLRPLAAGSLYALWLVDDAGHWTRVANFTPNGDGVQTVVLDEPVAGYTQCALTIESWPSGKRSGPLVMQSRIA